MLDWLRPYCLSFPHATESVQWEALVFKVTGKIFAVAALEPERHVLSIKCAEEKFAEMIETPGVVPAPYLARAKWIAFESENALPHQQLRAMIRESYDLVFAKLSRNLRESLTTPEPKPRKQRRK
jgi:predicted DNA-binding protein (MmcQ/YjbR family)